MAFELFLIGCVKYSYGFFDDFSLTDILHSVASYLDVILLILTLTRLCRFHTMHPIHAFCIQVESCLHRRVFATESFMT